MYQTMSHAILVVAAAAAAITVIAIVSPMQLLLPIFAVGSGAGQSRSAKFLQPKSTYHDITDDIYDDIYNGNTYDDVANYTIQPYTSYVSDIQRYAATDHHTDTYVHNHSIIYQHTTARRTTKAAVRHGGAPSPRTWGGGVRARRWLNIPF